MITILFSYTDWDVTFVLLPSEKEKLSDIIGCDPPKMVSINYDTIDFDIVNWISKNKKRITNIFSYGTCDEDLFEIKPNQ